MLRRENEEVSRIFPAFRLQTASLVASKLGPLVSESRPAPVHSPETFDQLRSRRGCKSRSVWYSAARHWLYRMDHFFRAYPRQLRSAQSGCRTAGTLESLSLCLGCDE